MRKLGTLARTQNESTTLNRRSLIRARCSRFEAQTRAGLRFDNKDRIEKCRRWMDAGVSRGGLRDEIADSRCATAVIRELVSALIIETRVQQRDEGRRGRSRDKIAIGLQIECFIISDRGCSRGPEAAGPTRAGQVTMRPRRIRARGSPISPTRRRIMKVLTLIVVERSVDLEDLRSVRSKPREENSSGFFLNFLTP
jgi:hypothetical protein